MQLTGVHHIAIICSDYAASMRFYTAVLGLRGLAETETYRADVIPLRLDLVLR